MIHPAAAMRIAKHLTNFLGTKITFPEVFDEMFLIENGNTHKNKILNQHIRNIMADYMKPKFETDLKKIKNPKQ